MANADVQGMLVRIEATTQQLRQELELADRAVASTSSKIDKSLAAVDAAFDRVNTSISQSSGRALDSLAASVEQAQSRLGLLDRKLGDIGASAKGFGGAMSAQSRALDDLIARIDPAAGALRRLNEQQAALGHFAQSGMLDSAQYASLTASIEAQRKALTGSGQAMHLAGISAGQYNAAMRMLPMQITDVVTSLAGGMPVWMVAIQQGGQLRDSFGGIGNMARGMLSVLNPATVAVGGLAAMAGGLLLAYQQGQHEAQAYNQALILTGSASGATADQLGAMASRIDGVSGTQRQAAAALAELAGTGKFAASQLEAIGTAAVAMENATGKAVSDTVKEFTSLAEEPAKASAKLNEQYNYLTVSVYRQIAALEEQGKTSEASKLATDAYAVALQQRSVDIEGSLGTLETAWKSIGDIASEAWDAMLNIGRPDTLEQQLDQVERKIKQRREDIYAGSIFDFGPTEDDLHREKTQLELSIQQRDTEAKWRAEQAAANKAAIAAEQELARQQDQLEKLKGNGSHEQEAIRWVEAHAAATQEDKDRVIARGKALDEQEAANKREAASTKSATSEAKKHTEALKDYLGKAAVATSAADAMAGAYFAGADSVRELTLQQKIEQELLKTGAGVRDAVTAAVKRQQDALDRLDLGKRYADLKLDTDQLRSQAVATLAGVDALQAFNAQKLLASALAGKNAAALGAESQQLLEQIKLNQEAAKAVEQAGKVQGVMDRLYPQQKLLRDYTEEQQALNKAIELYPEKADQYRAALERLGVEYEANKKAGTAWGQWTVSALERVDSAFADAWKNIGGDFKSFRNSLTDAFRQMLAELAHMAITKPIVLSIGAALGIGGSQQALANGGSGIWGMLGSAGSGSGLFGSVWSGLKSGGLSGALSGAGTWGSGMLSSLDSGAGQLFGSLTGSSSMTHAPLSYQLSNSSLGNLSSSLGYVGTGLAAVGSAMAIYNSYQQQGFKGALVTGGATALGAVFGGPIGAALGASVGNFVSGKLFGSGWQTKDSGLALQVRRGDLKELTYQYQEKDGGWLGSSGSRYRYSAMGAKQAAPLEAAFSSTLSGVESALESLGIGVSDSALRGLNVGLRHFSASSKDIEGQISKWFGKVADKATAVLAGRNRDLAGLSFDEVSALATALQQVNGSFESLHQTLLTVTPASAKLAKQLQDLAGGADQLTALQDAYYSAYFTDGEKAADLQRTLLSQFADLGMTLPTTTSGFRALVEAQDMTTQAGQQAYLSLLTLAPQLQQLSQSLDSVATSAAQARSDALSSLTDAYSRESNALTATAQSFDTLVGSLRDFRVELDQTIVATGSQVMQLSAARRQFGAVSAQALSGDQHAMTDLPTVGRQLAQAALAGSSTREEYVRTLASIKAVTAQVEDSAAGKRDVALEQLDAMQQQLTALGVLNQSVLSVADALVSYQTADAGLQQALRAQIGDGFAGLVNAVAANDPSGIASAVNAGFQLLDGNVDGLLTIDELRSALAGKATDGQLLQIITTLDANGDGVVSAIEAQGAGTNQRLEYVAGKLDLNNNGQISGFELLASRYAVQSDALAAELKTQMTALGLKTLTEGQIRAVLNAPAADIASLLAATDANGDGILTQVELDKARNDRVVDLLIESGQLREQLSTDFSAIDSNLDGKLTATELQKYLRSELGIVASNDGLKKLISSVDASGNGTISRLDLIAAEVKRQNAMDIAGLIGEADAGKLSDNALGVFGAAIQTATPNYGGYAGVTEAKLERAIAAATGVDRSEFSALGFGDLQTLAKNLGISKGYALGLGENVIDGVLPPAVVDQLGQSTARALGDAITARTGQPVPASTNYSALPEAKLERGIAALLGVSQDAFGLLSKAQLSSVAKSLKLDASYFPAFARGGFHAGGIRLVGEQGPELEVTGPSRIFNARQTAEMLGGGADTAAEVRSLRAAVAELGNALRSIAKHTQQTARRVEFLERWDYDGMPGARA